MNMRVLKLFFLLNVIMVGSSIFAQSPSSFSYQSVIRNNIGDIVSNGTIGMKISILQSDINGTIVFSETHSTQSNSNGLITVQVGQGNNVSGNINMIDWANGPFFMKTEIDPAGGNNYSITGTSQILSVPYALYSKKSATSESDDNNKTLIYTTNGF
jgi:hypothetical protein